MNPLGLWSILDSPVDEHFSEVIAMQKLMTIRPAGNRKAQGDGLRTNKPYHPRLISLFVLASLLTPSLDGQTTRPAAPDLLPSSTVAMVRIADVPLMADRLKQTALLRMLQDPQMKPLVGQLYRNGQEAFARVQEQIGLSLEQLAAIPQGEVCLAIVWPEAQEPALVVVLDTKDQVAQARKLMALLEEGARRRGGARGGERFGQWEIEVFTGIGPGGSLFLVERDGTFVLSTSRPHLESILAQWDGAGLEKTLAEDPRYVELMARCNVPGEAAPHLSWYLDPLTMFRRAASQSLAGATALALLPVLGLDGLLAVGGTLTFATGEFDQVQHLHVLMESPRYGVLDAIALRSGDSTPEPWVPGDCISYSTIHWDLVYTLQVVSRLYNGIMGEGALQEELRQRISNRLGVDFEKELLPLWSGRASLVQWVEPPVRINSVTTIVGLHLKDPQAMQPLLEKIVARFPQRMEKQLYGSVHYWSVQGVAGRRMRRSGEEGSDPPSLRQPQPCIGIVGDCLILTDSMKAFQEVVTCQVNPDRGLSGALDFKLILSKLSRQPGGTAPAAVQFQRPEEGLRFWYDLAQSESTRQRLGRLGQRQPVWGVVDQALKDHPLPPFEVLARYLAPGGGMLLSDQTGLHYLSFTLKRE